MEGNIFSGKTRKNLPICLSSTDGRKPFPINHGKTSDETLLEVTVKELVCLAFSGLLDSILKDACFFSCGCFLVLDLFRKSPHKILN